MKIFETWVIPKLELISEIAKITAPATVDFYNNGHILVRGQIPHLVSHSFFMKLDITGMSNSLYMLNGKDVRPQTIEVSNVTDFLLNPQQLEFSIGGNMTTWTEQKFWLKNIKINGTGKISLNGLNFQLEPLGDGRAVGEIAAIMTVTSSTPSQTDIENMIQDLCWILSLSQRLSVTWVKREVSNGTSKKISVRQIERDCKFLCPLISNWSQDVCNFLQTTYPIYLKQIHTYDLPVIIDYYVRSHTENTLELKFALASILMERLKFDWALKASAGMYTPRFNSNGLIRDFITKNGNKANFEELLVATSNSLGYPAVITSNGTIGTFTFIHNRNAIFHTGLSAASQLNIPQHWIPMRQELHKLLDQVDNLILRILGYSGKVTYVSAPNTQSVFP